MESLKFRSILAIVIFTLFTLFLVSCDPASTIKYEIVNKTSDSIDVLYKFVYNASGDTSFEHITIRGDSSKIISREARLGYVSVNDDKNDSIPLYWLNIKQGYKKTRQNFRDKKYWKFEKMDNHKADYILIVDTLLFNNE